MSTGRLVRISGALVEASPLGSASIHELVRVGEAELPGEVIRVEGDIATVQVHEDTIGLRVGEPLRLTGKALEVELGPGLLGSVLDGVGRPLERLSEGAGSHVVAGADAPTLDPGRLWRFEAQLAPGDEVAAGDVLGEVTEHAGFRHLILVPPDLLAPGERVRLAELEAGERSVSEVIGRLADGRELRLAHRWPVRRPRPHAGRRPVERPFVTGQRVVDFLFPVAEGGTVAVPGGFGTGKTVLEQSLARFADADVVVHVACGERGNEVAELLDEFPRLEDPRTGRPLLERTVLVVNTSNMPVAAREASVHLGLTIAEYFRDQGLRVAVLADSLSRWAEALREIAVRLRAMPGEEGYPTDLGSRLAQLFERSGRVRALGAPERTGALTFVAAISPPGGDLSEPVSQAALRVSGALWALDARLAHQRQFPAVDCEVSWTLQAEVVGRWASREVAADWPELRARALELLDRESALAEIASLVGADALQDRDRLELEAARLLREVVLGQSAFDPHDACSSPQKTWLLASLVDASLTAGREALGRGASFGQLPLGAARQVFARLRDAAPEEAAAREAEARAAIEELRRVGAEEGPS